MKRKSRCAKKQKTSLMSEDLKLMEPDAAAIDIGSRSHWVAVNPQGVSEPVREFKTFTPELERLADWLTECGATSVVMEATGVYWVPLYELLEKRGFKVYVVDAHTARDLPGRPKSDVKDCQWLRRLHSYGLLRGSFRPPGQLARGTAIRSQNRAGELRALPKANRSL
jgi:transposase